MIPNTVNRVVDLFPRPVFIGQYLFWLSFAEPEPPKGRGHLGVIIMRADSKDIAEGKVRLKGIHPGGQCEARIIPDGLEHLVEGYQGRLLTEIELISAGFLAAPAKADKTPSGRKRRKFMKR